jgi:hypothetical protein
MAISTALGLRQARFRDHRRARIPTQFQSRRRGGSNVEMFTTESAEHPTVCSRASDSRATSVHMRRAGPKPVEQRSDAPSADSGLCQTAVAARLNLRTAVFRRCVGDVRLQVEIRPSTIGRTNRPPPSHTNPCRAEAAEARPDAIVSRSSRLHDGDGELAARRRGRSQGARLLLAPMPPRTRTVIA